MSILVPCPSCSRHVRSNEAACPFCSGALPTQLAKSAIPAATRRLDRLATFTFAAAITVASAAGTACSGSPDDGGAQQGSDQSQSDSQDELKKKKKDAGADASNFGCDAGGIHAMYGMPAAAAASPCGTVEDGGGVHALYGMPAYDAGTASDDGGVHALYGAPAQEDDAGGIHAMYGLPAGGD